MILDSSVDDLKENLADTDVDVDALKMDGVKRKSKFADSARITPTCDDVIRLLRHSLLQMAIPYSEDKTHCSVEISFLFMHLF